MIARTAARAALTAARPGGEGRRLELGITLTDDAAVRALNRAWRGKDRATNVLSFPAGAVATAGLPAGLPLLLGDVVLGYGVCAAEAAAQGKTLADHVRHLVVHGVLHLTGHDHEDDAEAERMEALERVVLGGLGVADPYAVQEP